MYISGPCCLTIGELSVSHKQIWVVIESWNTPEEIDGSGAEQVGDRDPRKQIDTVKSSNDGGLDVGGHSVVEGEKEDGREDGAHDEDPSDARDVARRLRGGAKNRWTVRVVDPFPSHCRTRPRSAVFSTLLRLGPWWAWWTKIRVLKYAGLSALLNEQQERVQCLLVYCQVLFIKKLHNF